MTMVPSDLKRVALWTGLSFAAALMLSTAAFAQDATTGDEDVLYAVDPVVEVDPVPVDIEVQFWHDLNPGDGEGIAVGEPDPNDGGTVVDDGTSDGTVVDDGTSDGTVVDDGTGDGTVVDDGTGDGTVVDDGTGDGTVVDDGTDDGTVVDDGTDDGTGVDQGTDDGTGQDDGSVDQGTDDTSGGSPVDDGTVVIYYMDGGPIDCVECLYETAGLPGVELQMGAEGPAVGPVVLDHVKRSTKSRSSTSVQMSSVSDAAACLVQHPQLPWICEWQNGAGQ